MKLLFLPPAARNEGRKEREGTGEEEAR